jgi:predicted ATPase
MRRFIITGAPGAGKTAIIPSRKATKQYLGEESDHED